MTGFEDEAGPLVDLAKSYLDALLNVQKDEASRMILEAVENGTKI